MVISPVWFVNNRASIKIFSCYFLLVCVQCLKRKKNAIQHTMLCAFYMQITQICKVSLELMRRWIVVRNIRAAATFLKQISQKTCLERVRGLRNVFSHRCRCGIGSCMYISVLYIRVYNNNKKIKATRPLLYMFKLHQHHHYHHPIIFDQIYFTLFRGAH